EFRRFRSKVGHRLISIGFEDLHACRDCWFTISDYFGLRQLSITDLRNFFSRKTKVSRAVCSETKKEEQRATPMIRLAVIISLISCTGLMVRTADMTVSAEPSSNA